MSRLLGIKTSAVCVLWMMWSLRFMFHVVIEDYQ